MKIGVTKFRNNLALLSKAVPKKPTLEILSNACVRDGQLEATDLEVRISIALPEAREESFLVPYKKVMETLKYVPGDETLDIDTSKKKTLKLTWSGGTATFPTADVLDYPPVSNTEPRATGDLNGDILINALMAAIPYCATDESRPVLTGVGVYLDAASCQVAGADGFRMSYQAVDLHYPVKETIVLPASTVIILDELWKKRPGTPTFGSSLIDQITAPRPLSLSLWDIASCHYMLIKFGDITVHSRLLAGTFPDVLSLLGSWKEPIKVKVMAPELFNAARRVKEIANTGAGSVKMVWTGDRMTVSASSGEDGEISAAIPVENGANPGYIAVNLKYLVEYLAGKEGMITLGMSSPATPLVFHYGNRPVVGIMPMFVRWYDEENLPEVDFGDAAFTATMEREKAKNKPEEPVTVQEPAASGPPPDGDEQGDQEREEEPGEDTEGVEEPEGPQEDPEERQYDNPEPVAAAPGEAPKKRGWKKKTE